MHDHIPNGASYTGSTHDSGSCRLSSILSAPTKIILTHKLMKIIVDAIRENPLSLMRKAGYVFQRQEGDEMSFVRVLASAGYPRFHCYTKVDKITLTVNFHLDQKKHTYGETTRHHGEYENDGPMKEESLRLLSIFGEKARIA